MLTGKTAIVTGGTRGIGFAIVKKYLENGANVAVAGSRKESVDKALAQLSEYEGRVMGIWPDLCSPEEAAAAASEVSSAVKPSPGRKRPRSSKRTRRMTW